MRRYIVVLLLGLALMSGCKKKQKPQPPAPPPSIVPQAQAEPVQPPPQETQTKPEEQPPQETTKEAKVEPKPKPRPRKPRTKPSPVEPSGTEVAKATPPKPITPEADSGLGDISTSMPRNAGDQLNAQTTDELLKSTEDNLNKIKRALNADEQNMVKHIRGFVTEARQALVDGDSVRAHNLALKARLLSQELVTP